VSGWNQEQEYQAGVRAERDRIIALIERRICFDALADDDGRCSHHGGKCYDLRELITRLQRGE
jgi:hypothetical protein